MSATQRGEFEPEFDQDRANLWMLEVTSTKVKSLEELETRCYDYIRYNALQQSAMTRMGDLNRRFGQAAGKFDSDTRSLISNLVGKKKVTTFIVPGKRGTQVLLFPTGFLELVKESMIDDLKEFNDSMARFRANAFALPE